MTTDERPSRAKHNQSKTFTDPEHYPTISVHQPYAGLMWLAGTHGYGKELEIRSMRLNQRGPLVICAAKRVDRDAYLRAQRLLVGTGTMRLSEFEAACGEAMCGKAVALFDVVDCRQMRLDDHDLAFTSPQMVDVADQFAWVADTITALRPFDATGAQGFFRVRRDLVEAARSASTTREQRASVRRSIARKTKKKLCSCGREFPNHLAEFMNNDPRAAHVCACGTKYVVKAMKFVSADKAIELATEARNGA